MRCAGQHRVHCHLPRRLCPAERTHNRLGHADHHLRGSPHANLCGSQLTVSATTNSNGALSYSYVSGPCLPVSGGTFSPTGAGTCVVQASTASTATFLAGSAQQNVPITTVPAILVTTATDDATGTASNCPSPANCSLRDCSGGSLRDGRRAFDPTVFASPKTIQLSSGLTIPANTTITGPTTSSSGGTTNLVTVRRAAISINFCPVFTVNAGVTGAAVNNLIITNGYVLHGGGIFNVGTLTVSNSTISGNSAAEGGGIFNVGTLTVSNSTISGNSATEGGGIYNSGGALTVANSTISGDNATLFGGGIFSGGTLTVANSTISGNSVSVTGGGGILNEGTLTVSNSIVAGNSVTGPTGTYADIDGSYTDNGGNQASGSSSPTSTITINLAPLGKYGGATQTMVPLPGSPAICTGLAANIATGVTTDQRGYPNTNTTYTGYSSGSPCVDSGAVQSHYSLSFTGEPSPISPATSILTNTHFQAAVTLQEDGRTGTGAPGECRAYAGWTGRAVKRLCYNL